MEVFISVFFKNGMNFGSSSFYSFCLMVHLFCFLKDSKSDGLTTATSTGGYHFIILISALSGISNFFFQCSF